MKFSPSEHLIQLKGRDYLQVAWRLVWFREDHPDWSIDTVMTHYDPESKHAIFKATISDANGLQKSSGTGSESAKDFGDYIEKAETKAVGRALAMLGYGTQFCADELDEGERIVDSPINRKPTDVNIKPYQVATIKSLCSEEEITEFMKKLKIDRLEDMPYDRAVSMITWLKERAQE